MHERLNSFPIIGIVGVVLIAARTVAYVYEMSHSQHADGQWQRYGPENGSTARAGIMAGVAVRATGSGYASRHVRKRDIGEYNAVGMRVYNVGVLMASHLDSPFDLERCGPAVDLALDAINDEFLRPHKIKLLKVQASYPSCSGAKAPGLAADMHFKDDVIAFIGPACAFALEPVARLAAYWNSPIITGMGDQPPSEGELTVTSGILGKIHKWKNESTGMFKDKSKYPTLTRMSYCQCRLKLVFASIFRQFNWKHVALLVDRSDLFSLTVGKNLEYGLRQEGLLSFVRELNGNEQEPYENYLKDASMYARVVILSVRGTLVRKFMLAAYALGMTNGDWVFLDVEIFQSSYWGDHDWEMGDAVDSHARKAYEALLRVSLLQPTSPKFQGFADKVREMAKNYNYTFSEGEEVNFFIGAFYDGVYLLGMALNETLSEHGDIRDGMAITRRMWNRNFHGITGHVRIDDNGDRDADYSISDLDPINGKFEVVAHYYGLHREYSAVDGKKIHWPGGREGPPPDIPRCGFLGNAPECHGNELIILYGTFAFALFLGFTFIVVYLMCKQMKLNNELNNMSWRVRPDEVLLEVGRLYGSKVGLQKLNAENFSLQQYDIHSGRASIASCTSLPLTQVFTTIGIFKGERVAIKKIHRKKVDITPTLLWEIKQTRDVSHENTVRFVGACIDLPRPTVLILTEYCPKGSLKDVLENEAIQLDWNFRMSLIHDIVKGMAYLHNSDVQVHGKLRSCNCLIDGRFVLKISDFGLRTLTTPSEFVKDQNYFNKFLWIAPELLPLTVLPGNPATQKGDVYSFAIILEEIVVRGGPYEMARQFMDVQTILNRVEAHETPPFRPFVGQRDCPPDVLDLMEKCWADNPDDRPAFATIRSTVRLIMKGFCENLMDDLLRRMEQYANNLESLVEEKTEQLSMEKRRTEELLYQVLPRPVATQLLAGEMVQPEQFECVTIYFSDIVGFTALCAESGPMEVVAFLNDLYSTFDRIIGFYDVYKVETIGDAYMVVSGLPERNDNHAREIGLMSLAIVDAVKSFTIKHKPDYKLKIRIGIHAGPVCAGVVGQKMPHYCLFGDTVNTASRMESAGLPLKIHVSFAAKSIFDKYGTFKTELRGEVELKGKGTVTTYWLLGCSEPDPRPPTPQKNTNDEGMFKDKSKYPTLTRMSYCQCRLKLVFASIFRQFNWKHVALLVDRSDLFSLTVGKNLEYGLRQEGLLSFVRELNGNEQEPYENYLKDASMYARVVILSVRGTLVRKFMLAAYALGMTNGDWVFLDVEIFQSSYWGDHDWEMGDAVDSHARKAYEALLRVSLLQPTSPKFQGFADKVREMAKNYNYTFSEGEEVNFFIGAFYDGVYLLGMALNETLSEHGDIRDGMAITRRMWNRNFHGITGHVRIDDNGDRDADYSISDLDPINGKFEVVAHYYGLHREYSAVDGKKIHWPGGREGPPPDIPRCGFLGNAPECHGNELIILYGTFAFALFLGFTFIVVYLMCKQMKLNNELNNMSWRVRPDEVLLEVGRLYGSKVGLQKLNAENFSLQQYDIHSGRASIASCTSLPLTQVFTTIGIFKGERVAIKKIHRKKVDITPTLLWEIKQTRDVSHENTVRFVGACIDLPRPTVLILTEYCPKGSLKDVLENEAIQLDWNFRMSLIHDIVKGMAYLHNSDVQVHGKLRSCNCLIDGRFVLKISDFGLRTLTTPSEFVKDQNYFNKFLWIAPELLPLTVLPGNPATQKGDVYSFAIILEEIVVRGGPYEMARQFMDVQTILNRVEAHETPPFRPFVGQRDCPPDVLDLMEKCWADNPDDRPAFATIRSTVRLIMKGFCENLMDDLLRRMEQYANNLESLVEEKTEQLSMEKRRTEELLYQVLPRPVATQLLAGEMVQPEQFECVTIYFSDIVGFTALCAESGPMEVVAFLNDLYSTFDRIIGFYDVYKVETIGDAYMVVSGLPERNDNHAREIGLMSLAIVDAVKSFTIKHKPDYKLKIRIGIHAGPVCAGVVGQKMPHYCLFGDTVNTASRMESAGLPLKIHVSFAAKSIFDKYGTFKTELRGEVELKGKGTVTTYWLLGCSEPDPRPPTPQKNTNDEVPFPILFPAIGK